MISVGRGNFQKEVSEIPKLNAVFVGHSLGVIRGPPRHNNPLIIPWHETVFPEFCQHLGLLELPLDKETDGPALARLLNPDPQLLGGKWLGSELRIRA